MDTPIEFGTDGWRDTLDTFTTPRIKMVAQAVADYLREETDRAGDTIAVGYDARDSSPGFAEDVAEVLAANGFDVLVAKRDCPTPITAWTIVDRDLAGAMAITASHNPPEYNGVKYIPENGSPALPAVTEGLEARLREPDPLPEADHGDIEEVDFTAAYYEHALDLLEPELSDLTVVYDAMHGSGRGVTDELLERAGATVHRRRCERDPDFGGTPPEPSAQNLEGLLEAVREHDADLGVANDGDADRIAVVTPERGFLDENLFFAALYEYMLEDDAGPAVRTVSTTFLIDRIAEAHGQTVQEVPVGFKWVAQAMRERDALMGGEESGGFSIRGHVREKDGVLMALLASVATAECSLDDRIEALLAEHGEIHQDRRNLDCPDSEKDRVVGEIEQALPETVAGVAVEDVNDADGFKILLEDGSWLLARPSGTEPKLRIYAEADSADRVETLLDAGVNIVEPII
ncbi:phosphoglucomutase/phosphomannomutase family protein [Halorhabdus sp. CBA1104]|uniref:phosphoglucomutase/phosphomannomutase family protein n=1 Tax=unclassified Halorhabdus TaxID=2621901 RepID=UPI0012B41F59|nr:MULTISPECIES: phosphoglucomutase/phosphomannomutase family protein [unclassified Halorhabdus]QGN06445.1 phosphoglucomutase/phosphomannomutase family protein [Halorhabdus sp. CBA1104]